MALETSKLRQAILDVTLEAMSRAIFGDTPVKIIEIKPGDAGTVHLHLEGDVLPEDPTNPMPMIDAGIQFAIEQPTNRLCRVASFALQKKPG